MFRSGRVELDAKGAESVRFFVSWIGVLGGDGSRLPQTHFLGLSGQRFSARIGTLAKHWIYPSR